MLRRNQHHSAWHSIRHFVRRVLRKDHAAVGLLLTLLGAFSATTGASLPVTGARTTTSPTVGTNEAFATTAIERTVISRTGTYTATADFATSVPNTTTTITNVTFTAETPCTTTTA